MQKVLNIDMLVHKGEIYLYGYCMESLTMDHSM